MNYNSILLHIPHSSTKLHKTFGDVDDKLAENIHSLTDVLTDKLFEKIDRKIRILKFNYSRFFCDVERFSDDNIEPMAKMGQGFYYTNRTDGEKINRKDKKDTSLMYYKQHHSKLNNKTKNLVGKYGNCIIIDCHSFNDDYNNGNNPDICIGFDENINDKTISTIKEYFIENGYVVSLNSPYSGSIYPTEYKNENLSSVMIEINKKIYINNKADFNKTRKLILNLYKLLLKK